MTTRLVVTGTPDPLWLAARAALRRKGAQTPEVPDVSLEQHGLRVDVDRLAAYSALCGFRLGSGLPVTYPLVLAFPLHVALMARDDFPFPILGAVHLVNRITWVRPVLVDEPLSLHVRAEGRRAHRKGQVLDLVTDLHVDGARVWHSTSTYLLRGTGDPNAPSIEPPPVADLSLGPVRWRVDADTGRRYAAVSGDRNPIHLSALSARPFGFRHAIAHGMWSYARVMAHTAARMPFAGTSTVWFRAPIPLPSTVRLATDGSGRQVALRGMDDRTVHLVTATNSFDEGH
ncbi:MAG: hypothetical protein IPM08_09310 [Actinomycetales bacterium]|nr:hypothetical protein [Actinomycetales bacterium]